MKCPSCNREVGHHPYVKDAKGKMVPFESRCPNTGAVVPLDPYADRRA